MENTPEKSSPACCCSTGNSSEDICGQEDRRGFLAKAVAVVAGTVALAVPAVVGIVAALNPLRQKSQSGLLLRLTSLDALPEDGTPRKFPIIADRTDAWNRFPNEPIGAVYLRRTGAKSVEAVQTVCPHAGCSVQFTAGSGEEDAGGKFFCPCHAASFDLAGKRLDATSPSPRDLDTLEVEIRNETDVWVKFEDFQTGTAKKVAKA
ncbi:MAG TPA: Rieske (2Fe-2S) protein [Thermoguttaceae bacterium]|nr:Rieske (2Fe-2S) protein [Thermoguttaceae bacterium]